MKNQWINFRLTGDLDGRNRIFLGLSKIYDANYGSPQVYNNIDVYAGHPDNTAAAAYVKNMNVRDLQGGTLSG